MSVHVAGASPQSFFVGGRRAAVLVKGGAVVWRGEPIYRLETASADEPRVDWRLVGGVWTRGLLVEPAATNAHPQGRLFDPSDPPVQTTGVGLDGGPCAFLVDDDVATRESARADVVVPADTELRTWSVYLKRTEEPTYPQFRFDQGGSGNRVWLNTDTATGAFTAQAQIGAESTAWVEPGPDWGWRVVGVLRNASQTLARIHCFIATGALGSSDNTALGSVTVDGAQLEMGGAASSVILTDGATKSRAADVVSRDLAAGEVVLSWIDALGAAQSSTVQHPGGTFTLPAGPRRAYTSVTLDGVEQLDLDDPSAWTVERASEGTYVNRIGGV